MCIQEQRIDSNGIYVRFANGKELSFTKQDLKALVVQEGSKLKALQYLKQQAKTLLGNDYDIGDITVDFTPGDGTPIQLEWRAK
jgi:hypothetical protein